MTIRKHYKPVVRAQHGYASGAVLVGINSAIIGWNLVKDERPRDLMGFAIRRTDYDPETGEILGLRWLNGQKRFADTGGDFGEDIRSDQAPFQRFRWSDYTLNPDLSYRYDVFPMIGQPGSLVRGDSLIFNVRPSAQESGGIGIYANRGVTSSKAYFRRFGGKHPEDVPDGSAFRWLERGLKKSLLEFIINTQPGESLHVCVYEFFDSEIAGALKTAKNRGVLLHIVYHAKYGDHATHKSEDLLRSAGIKSKATARTNTGNISHNKFVVRLDDQGHAVRLWTASANFSTNAFYFQTNVALTFDDPALAEAYESFFQILKTDPKRGRKKSGSTYVQDEIVALQAKTNATPPAPMEKVLFSPVREMHVVDTAIDLISNAKSGVFLSAPFGVGKEIIAALDANNNDILEYGLANSTAKGKIEGLRHRNTRFFTPSRLKRYRGEAWDAKAFGAHKIHAKTLIIDPWGDDPAVLIGSANFSRGSCTKNDENTLLVRGDKRFSSIVASEFLRMFDHYKARFWIGEAIRTNSQVPFYLDDKESWSHIYYKQTNRSRKFRDREVFSGIE